MSHFFLFRLDEQKKTQDNETFNAAHRAFYRPFLSKKNFNNLKNDK